MNCLALFLVYASYNFLIAAITGCSIYALASLVENGSMVDKDNIFAGRGKGKNNDISYKNKIRITKM